MSREEVVRNIGTIARSGTREFLQALREARAPAVPELIGQFGVGFYSSFMVADRVALVTRRAGEDGGTRWESTGDGSYTLDDRRARPAPGTTVTLHLKPADEEDGLQRLHRASGCSRTSSSATRTSWRTPSAWRAETLNSMKAIWARPKDEVTEDEYREFYRHISHDWNDPLEPCACTSRGRFEARALLYIPSKAPFDLHWRDGGHAALSALRQARLHHGRLRDLLPAYLRFVRGVVDSHDLSLNVSREILQKDRQVQAIRKYLVRRSWARSRR